MPAYVVVLRSSTNQKKTIKTLQPSSSDAEQNAKSQFPGCEILSVGREEENITFVSRRGRWRPENS